MRRPGSDGQLRGSWIHRDRRHSTSQRAAAASVARADSHAPLCRPSGGCRPRPLPVRSGRLVHYRAVHRYRRRFPGGAGCGAGLVSTATAEPAVRVALPVALEPPRWGRATRVELLTLIAYFAGIVAFTDILNIRLGVEYMTLAVVVAAIGITRRPGQFLRDWWPLLLGLLLWNLSSALAALSPFPAHLDFMRNFDRVLGFGHDPVIEIQR